jgi:GTPase SAR1 family protein
MYRRKNLGKLIIYILNSLNSQSRSMYATSEFPMYHYQFRVIMIGDSTVGKSSLLRYFTEGRCAEISDPTIGVDFYTRMIEIKPNYHVKLQLWFN